MGIFNYFIEDRNGSAPEGVDTVIGKKAKFKGEIESSGPICVNGEFNGKISTESDLIIAQRSRIRGDVFGGNVIVSGNVEGNILAEHTLEIKKSGRVHGDLEGGKIVIEEGSSYQGKVTVKGDLPDDEDPMAKEDAIEEPSTMIQVEQEPQSHLFSNV